MPARPRLTRSAILLVALLASWTAPAFPQDRWGTWRAVGGGALGASVGAITGTLGSVLPCTVTYAGPHCVRWAAAGAVLVGGAAGAVLGNRAPGSLERAAVGGAIGFGIGSAVGVGLTPLIERWGAEDALALGLIGGAVGTAPFGAAVGFGSGGLVGALLWRTAGAEAPAVAALALGGLAVGVLTEWIVRAGSGEAADDIMLAIHVRF